MWWCGHVVTATGEAEAGELPEPRRRRLWWAEMAPLHSSLGNNSETPSKKKKKKLSSELIHFSVHLSTLLSSERALGRCSPYDSPGSFSLRISVTDSPKFTLAWCWLHVVWCSHCFGLGYKALVQPPKHVLRVGEWAAKINYRIEQNMAGHGGSHL